MSRTQPINSGPINSGDEALSATELLALERIGDTRFRSWRNQDNRAGAIFGGQPLAQAVAAAQATVATGICHSLSANFMRAGDADAPVDYDVERLRDGRRYAARRVLATQDGKPIFDAICSFHDPEEGPAHQMVDLGDVPAPDGLPSVRDLLKDMRGPVAPVLRRSFSLPFPVEIRLVDMSGALRVAGDGNRDLWFRVPSAAALDDPQAHIAMLAFASDYWLAGAAAMPHPATKGRATSITSLNHAMWFHAPVRADQWMLYRTSSPWAGHGRGLSQGLIFDSAGRLLASSSQEASMRAIVLP